MSDPQTILGAYTNNLGSSSPDLLIASDGNGRLNLLKEQKWTYNRLEIFGPGGKKLLVIPTLTNKSDSFDGGGDGIEIKDEAGLIQKKERILTLRCSMPCLIGNRITSVRIKLRLTYHDNAAFITFRKCEDNDGCCKIGSYSLKRNGQDWELPLTVLTSILTQAPSSLPYVDLDRTDPKAPSTGPLLELIGGSSWKRYTGPDFKGRMLFLSLVGAGGDYPTIQISEDDDGLGGLTTRSGNLRVGGVDLRTNGPIQSLTQRASDDWLARKSGKALLIQGRVNASEIWNTAVSDYERALSSVRSPNRVSLLPVFRDDPHSANWRVRWGADYSESTTEISGKTQSTIGVTDVVWQLRSVQPHAIEQFDQQSDPSHIPNVNGNVYFPFDPNTPQACLLSPDHADNQAIGLMDAFAFWFQLTDNRLLQSPQTRIGSVDVTFGGTLPEKAGSTPQEQRYTSSAALLNLAAYTDSLGKGSISVPLLRGDLFLPVTQVDPAGQDGVPGSEYVPENYDVTGSQDDAVAETALEQQFQGSAPVVIAFNSGSDKGGSDSQNSPKSKFWAEITESNPQIYSQTVSIKLHALADAEATGGEKASDSGRQVIVLDSDPFLVAEVRFDGLHRRSGGTSSDVIAIWNMNRVDGAGWELYTNLEPFRLVLPPQSLGEEMPKGRELEDKYNPGTGVLKALEFRIGPPAVEILQGSYTPQNYTEAPWNLRRILGYPGQRDAGAGVMQLQYELLYGLSCVAKAPMLRLAEIFATLGRIPGRLRVLPKPVKVSTPDPAYQSYMDFRTRWASYYALLSKRVAILEPRFSGANYGHTVGVQGASATPEVFTLDDGIQCTFRSSASLYYRAQSEVNAGTPVDQDEFNVDPKGLRGGATWGFEAPRIYHATLRNPNSSSAKLVNPYFSALGGSGYQKVSFDRGLTSVYSNTEIGRTFYYSVERMGRIGVYHNLARHVIEYERSVAPGPQFSSSQTAFCGGPVLRKMREYIQILEPKVYLSAGKTPYPECGFAKGIEFKTEIIPVDSSWGANVGSTGWKIPLWRRSAQAPPSSPARTRAKKKPADAGTGCLPPPYSYSKPEVIFDMAGFDGADVECAITDPEKLFFYTETDENARPDPHEWPLVEGLDFSLAAVPAQNPGFQSSSVNEIRAYDAAVPAGLSAFTLHLDPGHGPVNMVHGRTAQALGSELKSVTFQRPGNVASKPALQSQIESATKILRERLFTEIRTGGTNLQALVVEANKLVLDTSVNPNTGLQATLNNYVSAQTNQLTGPAAQLLSRIQSNFAKWTAIIDTDVRTYQEDWNAQWKRINTALSQQNYRLQLKTIADNEIDALFALIEALPVSVNPLGRLCATVDRALDIATSRLNSAVAAFDNVLSQEATTANLDVSVLGSQIAGFSYDVHSTLDQLRAAIQSAVESWMPGVGLLIHVWEETVFGVVAQMDALVGSLTLKVSDVQGYLQILKKPPTPLESFKANLEQAADAALKKLNLKITDLDTQVQTQIEGAHKSVRGTVDSLIDGFAFPVDPALVQGAVLKLAQQAQAGVATQLQSQLKTLLDQITSTESIILTVLTSLISDASAEVAKAIAGIIPGGSAEALEAARKKAEDALGRYVDSLLTNLPPQIDLKSLPVGNVVDTVLQRAFGAAPNVPNLNFSLPNVGYFYLPGVQAVNLTPLLTQVSGLGAALSPLGSMLPSTAILDRMLPSDLLKNFNLSDVLPNFAGLKLDSLFSGLKMPDGAAKYIKISHGLDQSSKRAWVQADINFSTDTVATLFTIGPIALQLPKATFACQVKLQADASGQIVKQATGSITGDWTLIISGTSLVTMTSTSLSFDEQGHVHFNVSPDRVVLAQALNFIEQIIASYSSPDSGFSIVPSPTGIETRLDLPIPNTSGGTTGITNLTVGFSFGLQFAPFAITAGFNLGRKKAPFNIMVFILGGAGYVETDITFVPGKQLQCSVTIELAASASLAIAFGPISGYVAIFLGMSVNFRSGAGSDLRLGIFIQVIGEVSILSIVSAYVGLRLEATYENGTFTGRGQFTISIKICWCFTLDVDEHVEFTVGGGGGGRSQHEQLAFNEPPRLFASHEPISDSVVSILPRVRDVNYSDLAVAYISMIS